MPAVAGRWVWTLSGLVVIGAIASAASAAAVVRWAGNEDGPGQMSVVPARTVAISQQVTSINVESYGAPIHVTGAPVRRVRVMESIRFGWQDGPPPVVTQSVSGGRLTLAAPACEGSGCSVGFTVTVPENVAVTAQSDGGPLIVSGVAAANLDSGGGQLHVWRIPGTLTVNSGGGPVLVSRIGGGSVDSGGGSVHASHVRGSLSWNTGGGDLTLTGLTGPLDADTAGGQLVARDIAAATAAVNTGGTDADIAFVTAPKTVDVDTAGGTARLDFADAPGKVTINTGGGDAIVAVPGGPYAVTAQTEGGPENVAIATNPAASRSISVDTGGGGLRIAASAG